MFIYPTSIIVILKDVPLDPSYDHTIYFDDIATQHNYFLSKRKQYDNSGQITSKYYLSGQTYTRVGKNIRVNICADDLYDCNYLMFQNTNFGQKWFYAFIKSVTYLNNEVSEIEYEIDIMQTWFFDYTLGMTLIDREHSASDEMFENILEENLEIGKEMVCVRKINDFLFTDLTLIVLYAGLSSEGLANRPNLLPNGYYLPAFYNFEPCTSQGATDMTNFIIDGQHIRDPQEVISVYQAPAVYDAQNETITDPSVSLTIPSNENLDFDGYTPKNKKLYCSPYNVIIVSNNVGGCAVFKFEDSTHSNHDLVLRRVQNSIPTPSSLVYPATYRGIDHDYDSGLVFDGFPVCGYVTDTFKCWWAQNKNSFKAQVIQTINGTVDNSIMNGLASTAQGVQLGGAIAGVSGLKDIAVNGLALVAKLQDIEAMPNQASGQFNADTLNLKLNRLGFTIYHMHIKKEYAIIVDNYFTRFGYACKKVKYPNRKARRYWTFVKTVGCVIEGVSGNQAYNKGMPADDEAKICEIYDHGITFWKYTYGDTFDVGNYTLNNACTGVIGG